MKQQTKGNAVGDPGKNLSDRKTGAVSKAHKVIIYDLLPVGKENRISSRTLTEMLGVDNRDLRRMIRRERIEGRLIASTKENGGGYYIPEGAAETREFLEAMDREARSIFFMMKGTRAAVKEAMP